MKQSGRFLFLGILIFIICAIGTWFLISRTGSPDDASVADVPFAITKEDAVPESSVDIVSVETPQDGEWVGFEDASSGIRLSYPSDWAVRKGDIVREEGNIIVVSAMGKTQTPDTELFDGASFAVMEPVPADGNLADWMRNRYENQPYFESAPSYANARFGGEEYEMVTVCGVGCYANYHIEKFGRFYGFTAVIEGPDSNEYQDVFALFMESIRYLP